MSHSLQCSCGQFRGTVTRDARVNRVVCYCADCQAFAHYLGRSGAVLDEAGGTDVIQTVPANVSITVGHERLACVRLSHNGLMRWYAACCNTPIANTPASIGLPFVGLVHSCLDNGGVAPDSAFGPVRMRVNTRSATVMPRPRATGVAAGLLRVAGMVLRARIDGSYRRTPFFIVQSGAPVVEATVLGSAEREALTKTRS